MIIHSFIHSTGDAYPSNDWLSMQLSIDKRSVSRAIAVLQDKGYLHEFQDSKKKRHLTIYPVDELSDDMCYENDFMDFEEEDFEDRFEPLIHKDKLVDISRVDKVVYANNQKTSEIDNKNALGRQSCHGGVDKVVYHIYKDYINNNYKKEKINKKEKEDFVESDNFKNTSPKSFDEFWELYPRKVNKVKTMKLWYSRQIQGQHSEIIEKLKKQCASRVFCKFSPNPLNYLFGERWNDEYEGMSKSCNTKSNNAVTYNPVYFEYVSKCRADIRLGLKSKELSILGYEDWISCHLNQSKEGAIQLCQGAE